MKALFIWIIKSTRIYIFFKYKVSLTTIAEIYNENDHTINHHGFDRNVKEKEKIGETKVRRFIFWPQLARNQIK